MVSYKVQMQGLLNNADSFEKYMRQLEGYSNRVDSIRNNLSLSDGAVWSIKSSLRTISNGIDDEAGICRNIAGTVQRIRQKYETTENTICGNSKASWSEAMKEAADAAQNIINNGETAGNGAGKEVAEGAQEESGAGNFWKRISDLIYKPLIAAAGPLGVIADGIRRGFEGKWGNVIGDFLKLSGGFVKNLEGTKVKWADWFKLNPATKGPWKTALGKYIDFSSVKKGFSSICNWGAELIAAGFSNYKEHGNFGTRFWGETVTETLIKVGEGVVFTAAAGIILGASAPGWAVALGAAGITVAVDWGLDTIATWRSGGTQTSWIASALRCRCTSCPWHQILSGTTHFCRHPAGR